ncbi:MAG: peptidase S8 [Planctomycetes bacterium]|nr:peptidase S8 [Planctomycetota bacterium]
MSAATSSRLSTSPLALALLGLALVGLSGCGGEAQAPAAPEDAPPAERFNNELVLDLVDGSDLQAFLKEHPELAGRNAHWNSPSSSDEAIAVLRVEPHEVEGLLESLRKDPRVEGVERNAILRLPMTPAGAKSWIPDDDTTPARDSFPNDPFYEKQWNMKQVKAREAWRFSTGHDVIVAVIDTGVAYEDAKGLWAPDLKSTRFVAGYDFVNDDTIAADDHGHGTHCAGTIAQSTDNGRGVVGLAPNCKIMPLKVLSAQGWGTTSDIADAIRFAADNGAHVISMSLGGGGYSRLLRAAIDHALSKGVVVIAAAGNANRNRIEYPGAYPGVLAVTAVGPSGKRAFYSSYGREAFIAAPGGDLREGDEAGVLQNTVMPHNPDHPTVYAYFQGTSMATPHVAGAAALLRQAGVTNPKAVASILAASAQGSGWNREYGHGILDAGAAVRRAVFLPSIVSLALGLLLVVVVWIKTGSRQIARFPLLLGMFVGASGLFFLIPFGLAELPVVGGYLTRAAPDWGLVAFGPEWHWNVLLASALIPAVCGLISLPTRPTRALGVGLALGWAARLFAGVALPYADVQGVPGHGVLDSLWLAGNGVLLVGVGAYLIRLARTKFAPQETVA